MLSARTTAAALLLACVAGCASSQSNESPVVDPRIVEAQEATERFLRRVQISALPRLVLKNHESMRSLMLWGNAELKSLTQLWRRRASGVAPRALSEVSPRPAGPHPSS